MKLEQQVVSLELAKQLKSLGVKQDSLFYWRNWRIYCDDGSGLVSAEEHEEHMQFVEKERTLIKDFAKDYSAFTVAELGEMLPPFIRSDQRRWESTDFYSAYLREGFCYSTLDKERNYTLQYILEPYENYGYFVRPEKRIVELNEADARAKMLIWLIENGYLSL